RNENAVASTRSDSTLPVQTSESRRAVAGALDKKMPPFPLPVLAAVLLLCLATPHAAGNPLDPPATPTPTPTPWPHQFHAKLLMDYKGNLSLADLWYDWPGGRNLHVIRYQLAADAPYYDAEWNNGTSFFY
uniref:Uncharacterized protein n=1 Tax=Aegilops tauschii subsp. strangulata TaxID=200361 RepID=A0A453MID3_AEGTS